MIRWYRFTARVPQAHLPELAHICGGAERLTLHPAPDYWAEVEAQTDQAGWDYLARYREAWAVQEIWTPAPEYRPRRVRLDATPRWRVAIVDPLRLAPLREALPGPWYQRRLTEPAGFLVWARLSRAEALRTKALTRTGWEECDAVVSYLHRTYPDHVLDYLAPA